MAKQTCVQYGIMNNCGPNLLGSFSGYKWGQGAVLLLMTAILEQWVPVKVLLSHSVKGNRTVSGKRLRWSRVGCDFTSLGRLIILGCPEVRCRELATDLPDWHRETVCPRSAAGILIPGMVAHVCNPRNGQPEAGGSQV